MYFARTTSIALFDANYFLDLHTAWMMRYSLHVRYGNDPLEEKKITAYSDSRVAKCGQSCDQMYIKMWQRVKNSEGKRSLRKTVVKENQRY
jgi:hypothetical protein